MIQSPSLLLTIGAFLALIGPLVFVHEMGHYWAARLFGVKIDAFSIGMGREVGGWTDKRGTRWKLAWLPVGGYVKFAGDMNAGSQPSADWLALPAAERARTFQAKPVWQRAIIVAAGPAVNFVLALLILGGFALAYGDLRTPPVVAGVDPAGAAAAAGVRTGERIVAIDGDPIATFDQIAMHVMIRPGERVRLDLVKDDQRRAVAVTIKAVDEADEFGNKHRIGRLGIVRGPIVVVPVSLTEAPGVAVGRVRAILGMMTQTLGQIITGHRSVKELGGPLQIAKASGEQMSLGWNDFVGLLALVSINLGFINLLPVPMLDGGHLLFYAIEAVRRRPVSAAVQEWAYRGGLAALLALMLLVTINDLGARGLWQALGRSLG